MTPTFGDLQPSDGSYSSFRATQPESGRLNVQVHRQRTHDWFSFPITHSEREIRARFRGGQTERYWVSLGLATNLFRKRNPRSRRVWGTKSAYGTTPSGPTILGWSQFLGKEDFRHIPKEMFYYYNNTYYFYSNFGILLGIGMSELCRRVLFSQVHCFSKPIECLVDLVFPAS
ncbi:hypothetical protein SDJN03_23461, partial [Cucurbita argyrosperma subsp. sororia]